MTELQAVLDAIDTRWFLVLCLIVLDAWSIGLIMKSGAPGRDKAWWSVIVILCPIVGCLFWYTLGPKPLVPLPEEQATAASG